MPDSPPARDGLPALIARQIAAAGGWLPFERFMHLALYAPGLGYYAHGSRKFGALPESGSDFVTAPELSPLFARALAVQVADSLAATGTDEVWEFGAGSGALAAGLIEALDALGQPLARYTIVDVSGALRARQRQRLAAHGARVAWADALPPALRGVVVGNEVLDAMPVTLLARQGGQWHERGVIVDESNQAPTPDRPAPAAIKTEAIRFAWADRPTVLRPPVEVDGAHDYLTELHPQAHAFVATVAEALRRGGAGAAYFIDYGFPEAEYYHPQRSGGTLVCHRAHRVDDDPLADVGDKDITAHVNFTGVALAAQDAGLDVLGYTSQGRFLLNRGIARALAEADLPTRANAMKLLDEHEMGELFKVIGLATPGHPPARGFAQGDRTHRL
ncbi:MAG TPA: SAM-dependent methyltransferase [Ottowia sp.]|nr:SAM-dependent methyltransferase [Ottowia sp.]HMT82677.1 SAM-dependent methyltransferase [Ottowia sp.]HPP98703.1 SAM-dependent methyltransferase [Ottowia sp.]HQX68624.1 SAM-dependent methyltransferase [Ottowia sp.]HRB11014.1 SAM-dependent methyltransferase [Ottowia sp.]